MPTDLHPPRTNFFLAIIAAASCLALGITAKAQSKYFDVDLDTDAQTPASPIFQLDVAEPVRASPDVTIGTRPSTIAAAGSTTQPEATSAARGQFPGAGISYGLQEFFSHFAPYQPVYFIGGTQTPNIKFQFSFRYRILTPTGPLATDYPWLKGFNFSYTQTSLWNLNAPSEPFFDSSYKPEFFYYLENLSDLPLLPSSQLGFQLGVGHESNGQGGAESRSLNMVYLRPIVNIPIGSNGLFLSISPKLYEYIGSLSDNPDIARYRGHADIQFDFGWRDGLQLSVLGRVGDHFDRGSAQLDLTYPLTKILNGSADLSLDVQYFIGYGESLLDYNKRTSIIRIGFALVR